MLYGFGVIDAQVALNHALNWGQEGAYVRGPRMSVLSGDMTPGTNHHGGGSNRWSVNPGHSMTLEWDYNNNNNNNNDDVSTTLRIEHVRVFIEADTPMGHGYFGATLCGPSGVCSQLSIRGRGVDTHIAWSYSTLRHWDETILYIPEEDVRPADVKERIAPSNPSDYGKWTLRVGNLFGYRSEPVVIRAWGLTFHGTARRRH